MKSRMVAAKNDVYTLAGGSLARSSGDLYWGKAFPCLLADQAGELDSEPGCWSGICWGMENYPVMWGLW